MADKVGLAAFNAESHVGECGPLSGIPHHIAQHVLQNSAMSEVIDLIQRIDTAEQRNVFAAAIGPSDLARHIHAWDNTALDTGYIEGFRTLQLQCVAALSILELQRQDTHPDQIRAVNTLEAFDDDRLDAQNFRIITLVITPQSPTRDDGKGDYS